MHKPIPSSSTHPPLSIIEVWKASENHQPRLDMHRLPLELTAPAHERKSLALSLLEKKRSRR